MSTHRRRVGIVPDCSAHCATGNGTPSSCTNTTPSTSGSGTSARLSAEPPQGGREGVVGPRGRQPGQEGADRGGDPRRGDQRPEGRDLDARYDEDRQVHHDGLSGDREKTHGPPADRTRHRGEHGTKQEAEHAGDRRSGHESPRRAGVHAWEQLVRDDERHGADRPCQGHARQVGDAQPDLHAASLSRPAVAVRHPSWVKRAHLFGAMPPGLLLGTHGPFPRFREGEPDMHDRLRNRP